MAKTEGNSELAKRIKSEDKFRACFQSCFDGWTQRVEPARGTTDGIPDLLCLTDAGIIPVELKVGKLEGDTLWPEEVRPSQIAWHRNFDNAGGIALFAVGVWTGEAWRCFLFRGTQAPFWDVRGYRIGKDCFEAEMDWLREEIENIVADRV